MRKKWWREKESNLRRHTPPDLQSGPFGRLGISPEKNFPTSLLLQPTLITPSNTQATPKQHQTTSNISFMISFFGGEERNEKNKEATKTETSKKHGEKNTKRHDAGTTVRASGHGSPFSRAPFGGDKARARCGNMTHENTQDLRFWNICGKLEAVRAVCSAIALSKVRWPWWMCVAGPIKQALNGGGGSNTRVPPRRSRAPPAFHAPLWLL